MMELNKKRVDALCRSENQYMAIYKTATQAAEPASALPAPVLEQDPSQSLGRKRKHMELEPEIKVLWYKSAIKVSLKVIL
ncbi:hypothetical protein Tco_1103832 [Tanacetum coccineum]